MPPGSSVHVGVGAWVERDGCLLLLKRAGAHGAGTWSLPGGWLDHGEQAETAAAREVLEETYLSVRPIERMGWTTDPDEYERWITTLFVRCLYTGGDPRVTEPDKCPEVAWVFFEDVEHYPLFAPLRSLLEKDGLLLAVD